MRRTEVRLSQVVLTDDQDMHLLELSEARDDDGARTLTLLIGREIARIIADRVRGERPERPMTHDLMRALLASLGGSVEEVEIVDLREGVYYARLRVRQGEQVHELDARPSDAVALAVGTQARLYVAEEVWDEVA